MYSLFAVRRHDTSRCTALGRATASKKSTRKSLHLCGYVPRGEHRKMRVLIFSRMPSASRGPCFPRAWGMRGPTGMAPPQETMGLHGDRVSALFLLNYGMHPVAATPHFSACRVQTRGRRSRGDVSPGGVSLATPCRFRYARSKCINLNCDDLLESHSTHQRC